MRKSAWNYLRVRGEYTIEGMKAIKELELPPRARRIPPWWLTCVRVFGTTSACAENTAHLHDWGVCPGNYLRVRGEYLTITSPLISHLELPPRARRIPLTLGIIPILRGTTSACAENTYHMYRVLSSVWNYLRVRGEYVPGFGTVLAWWELPPRARRIRGHHPAADYRVGTTSACAENTTVLGS